MQNQPVFEAISALLHNQVQCVLATVDGAQPCLHLMAYAFNPSLSEVFIASYKDTRKVHNMLKQSRVSFLWDNRTGHHQDHLEGLALNAVGTARLLEAEQQQLAAELLLKRNASLAELLNSDNVVIFSVAVESYTFVTGYNQVHLYQPTAK